MQSSLLLLLLSALWGSRISEDARRLAGDLYSPAYSSLSKSGNSILMARRRTNSFGLGGVRKIVEIQKKYCPAEKPIVNGIQTNGILLDREWCRFLTTEGFIIGLSIDGPELIHNRFRVTDKQGPTHSRVLEAYRSLREYNIPTECLCVVHSETVQHSLEVYDFFCDIGASYLTFLPLVEYSSAGLISDRSVPSKAWGEFLCAIFDVWLIRWSSPA
jgi:uncharacterized protein